MGDSSRNAKKKNIYEGKLGSVKSLPRNAYRQITSLSNGKNVAVSEVGVFLLKVAALETVRRVSKSKCPPVWHGIQALQLLCYPPFKWIQKWAPFKGLVKGIQVFSSPLLVLSVATAFSDQLECNSNASNDVGDSQNQGGGPPDSSSIHSSIETSTHGTPENLASESWLIQLQKELENQGIFLPGRINEDELRRFYTAANGDFSSLLLSIKKTIRWRETCRILSEQELEIWSNMVFWHGYDVENRPCLIVCLGSACSNLPSPDRPRFAQAVISQVEHGVLQLVDKDNPQITVIVDCDGISPLRFPMQMMRSCSALLQDNYPNRLGHLLVIRLPPVVRVIAQTFIQVLKPVTRKKLRIEGKMYQRILSEYLQTVPAYLGGTCTCRICSDIVQRPSLDEITTINQNGYASDIDGVPSPHLTSEVDIHMNDIWDHLLRTAVIGILMVWLLIALVVGFLDPESRPFWSPEVM